MMLTGYLDRLTYFLILNVYKSILYTCIEAFKLYSSESLHKLLNIIENNEMSFFLTALKIQQCKIFYVGFQTCNN